MKKVLCLIALCLVFSSCAAPPEPLSYQTGLVRATFDVTLGGEEFTLALTPGDGTLEVVSPECIGGVRLVRETAKYSLVSEGTEMDLPLSLLSLSEPLFGMFSLSAANVENNNKLGDCIIKTDFGVYTVELSEDGTPDTISFEGARSFEATNIRLEYKEIPDLSFD